MPSTYTLNNGIELIGTGEQSGTWGDTTNTNLELLDTALDGQVTITATSAGSSSSPNDLPISDGSASNGRNRMVIITSATDLGADVYYQLTPNDAEKIIYVRNDLNAQDLILFQGTYNASNDYVVPNGKTAIIFFDGAGTGAVAANVMSNAHFDSLNIVGNVDIGGTLTLSSADPNIIFTDTDTNYDNRITSNSGAGYLYLDLDVNNEIATSGFAIRNHASTTLLDLTDEAQFSINTDTLFVNSANDAVGVNTTSPQTLAGNIVGTNAIFTVTGSAGSVHVADTGNSISFSRDNANYISAAAGSASDLIIDTADQFLVRNYDTVGETSTGRLQITGAGTTFNPDGADIDFTVESDTRQYMFHVDGTNSKVGINSSAPTGIFEVYAVSSGSATSNLINFVDNDGNNQNSETPIIHLGGGSQLNGIQLQGENIEAYGKKDLVIKMNNGTDYAIGSVTERFRFGFGGGFTNKPSNGGHTVFNEDGSNADFRIESDDTEYALFVDGASGGVTMGTNTQETVGTQDAGRLILANVTGASPQLKFFRKDTSIGGGDTLGVISAYNNDTTSNNILQLAKIELAADGTFNAGDNPTKIVFHTTEDATETTREVGKFDNAGIFKVVKGAEFNTGATDSTSSDFKVNSDTLSPILFVDANTNTVNIGGTSGGERLTINNGALKIGGGDPSSTATNNSLIIAGGQGSPLSGRIFMGDRTGWNMRFSTKGSGTITDHHYFYDSGAITINANQNTSNFRVDTSGTQNTLYVDGTDDYVTVGSNELIQGGNLNIHSTQVGTYIENSADANGGLTLYNKLNDSTNGGFIGITFRVSRDNAASNALGMIQYQQPTYNTFAGRMHFKARNTNGNYYEHFRIDSESGVHVNAGNDSLVDFHVDTVSHNNFLMVDSGANKVYVGSGTATDSNVLTARANYSQTYSSSATEGQVSVTLDNTTNGNNQHSGIHFRVSTNGQSNNAQASIGLKQPAYNSHNGQIYFNLRSQSQNATRQYMLIDSESGVIVNDGGESYMDFRAETDSHEYAFVVDASADSISTSVPITHSGILHRYENFSIPANTNRRLRVSVSNYHSCYVRVMALRTNGGNSVVYWEGMLNVNNNAGYSHAWNSRTSGGTISYSFANNDTYNFDWDFNNTGSGGTGTIFLQAVTGTPSITVTTYT